MPFENHGNRSFTAISVHKNAPAASGVYGLSNAGRWLFVGEASDIRAELLKHLQHPSAFVRKHAPTGFTYELSAPGNRVSRQNRLILELEPVGNRLIGDIDAI